MLVLVQDPQTQLLRVVEPVAIVQLPRAPFLPLVPLFQRGLLVSQIGVVSLIVLPVSIVIR
jgi:hypothetical protein